jgi:predicted peptidase
MSITLREGPARRPSPVGYLQLYTAAVLQLSSSILAAQGPRSESASFDTIVVKPVHLHYLIDLPQSYSITQGSWPLVLFLHGAGERGSDLDVVRSQGLPKMASSATLPFILVAPQTPDGELWSADALVALLDHLETTLRIDRSREYLTGLSMGAFGAWELAMAVPDRFAAVLAISGGANPVEVCRLRHVPVWIVHGGEDDVIPVSWSETLAKRLEACSGRVRLTIYPGVGHDAWSRTYADTSVMNWLLAQRRTPEADTGTHSTGRP